MGFSLTVSGSSGTVHFGKEVITSVRANIHAPSDSLSKSSTVVAIVRITGKIIPGGLLSAAGPGGVGGLLSTPAGLSSTGELLNAAGAGKVGHLLGGAADLSNADRLISGATAQSSANSLINMAATQNNDAQLYQQIIQQGGSANTGANPANTTPNSMDFGAMAGTGADGDQAGDALGGGPANSGSTRQLFLWSLVPAKEADAYRKVEIHLEGAGETFRTIVLPNAFVLDYSESYHHMTGNGKFNLLIQQRADRQEQITVS